MADYDPDDPNKTRLSWSNVNTWLDSLGVCSTAITWVKEKLPEFEKVKTDIQLSKGTYNMDSSIYVLEKFIEEKQFQWAEWFIVEILTDAENKLFTEFILEQIPKDIDEKNEILKEEINNTQSCAKNAIDNNKASAVKKTLEYVIRVNSLCNSYINTDNVYINILHYGIDLIKNRKG